MNKPLTYGLLLSILMVIAPHADHLPLWVSSLCAGLLVWRAYLAYSGHPLPQRWLLLLLTLASTGVLLISFRTMFGREVGVTLLMLLAALKLMELRAARDAVALIYLACFIIITNFLYSQSIPTALYLLATLLVIVTTWVHLQAPNITLKPRLRIAAVLLMQAVPLMLILFVLFPRIQGPLWGLPQNAYGTSGLDEKMSPGSMSGLVLSEAVVLRVSFTGSPPLREQMYWRGPVLWDFDGRVWTKGQPVRSKAMQLDNLERPIDYVVTLEPHNKTWLFALEMPTQLSIPSGLTDDFQLQQKDSVTARLRYNAHSQLTYRANAEETPQQLQRALRIPADLNPRAQQLAAEWRERLLSDDEVIREALAHFTRENFYYTLEPPLLGLHTVDDFMFNTRSGFCEHYASSFVFLMRAAGIPARVVAGYQGAEYNDYGNYYIVRQSDAHAWAEVWLHERGWVRVDPTAAISPTRVQSGLSAALPDNIALPFMARNPPQWLSDLRLNWDALAYHWNQWVLGYDAERQFAFLTRLGMESNSAMKMALSMLGGTALLIGLFMLYMLRRMAARNTDVAQQLYLKFCRKLARAGVTRAAHEGAQDFAQRAMRALPRHTDSIRNITAQYLALRYSPAGDGQKTARDSRINALRHAVSAFKI